MTAQEQGLWVRAMEAGVQASPQLQTLWANPSGYLDTTAGYMMLADMVKIEDHNQVAETVYRNISAGKQSPKVKMRDISKRGRKWKS